MGGGCMKWCYVFQWNPRKICILSIQMLQSSVLTGLSKFITLTEMTHTKSAGIFECCHQASLHCSLLQSSIKQYMGSWQLHICIFLIYFDSLVCSHRHSGSVRSTSPQPDEVLPIVASMVVFHAWSIPRWVEMATLVLCGDTGPKHA